jgi:hypothetical protein
MADGIINDPVPILDQAGKCIPEPYLTMAQEHVGQRHRGRAALDLTNAFVWTDTPQGDDFWEAVSEGRDPVIYDTNAPRFDMGGNRVDPCDYAPHQLTYGAPDNEYDDIMESL